MYIAIVLIIIVIGYRKVQYEPLIACDEMNNHKLRHNDKTDVGMNAVTIQLGLPDD